MIEAIYINEAGTITVRGRRRNGQAAWAAIDDLENPSQQIAEAEDFFDEEQGCIASMMPPECRALIAGPDSRMATPCADLRG